MSYRYRKIKDYREDRDLKQIFVASHLGITRSQYSRYERGFIEIPTHHLRSLARLLDTTMDKLTEEMEWVDLTS